VAANQERADAYASCLLPVIEEIQDAHVKSLKRSTATGHAATVAKEVQSRLSSALLNSSAPAVPAM
jgi:hypothetical protein